MFWSETGAEARLQRAGMDGSARRVLLRGPLRWPASLAVDASHGRLYWSDAGLACIGSVTLEGDDMKLFQLTESPSPFSVAVFESALYWSDTRRGTVQMAQKSSGKQRRVLLKQPGQALGIKGSPASAWLWDGELVVLKHHDLTEEAQIKGAKSSVENPCVSTRCSHQCVLAPGLRGVCKCPSLLELDQDGLACSKPDDSAFLLLLTPTAISQVYMHRRHTAAGVRGWPEEHALSLPGVKRPAALAVWDSAAYVWDAGQMAVRVFSLSRASGTAHRSTFVLRGDTLVALAVDWITGALVWSGAERPGLLVTSVRGEHTALLLRHAVGAVGAIALHPPSARLCFTNSPVPGTNTTAAPTPGVILECAHMDGQNRTAVWTKAVRPISLSLSNNGDVLYWADAGLGVIASVGINGYKYKAIKLEESVVAFALADRVLVWVTRQDSTKCWFSDDHQRARLWFEVETEVVDMKAFSKTSQKGTNACSNRNGGCRHLCLAFPGGRTCRCAHGYVPVNETDCVLDSRCSSGTRACLRGDACVPQEHFCNGRPDCPDSSDEICFKDEAKSGEDTGTVTAAPPATRPKSYDGPVLVKTSHIPKSPSPMGPDSLDAVLVKSLGVDGGVLTSSVPLSPVEVVPADAVDVKVGGTDSEACGARLCNGNGMCVWQDEMTVCECVAGYSGDRCQEQVGEAMQGPVVYAAAGLCVAVVAIGVAVGIIRRKKAASQRQAEPILREPSMRDLEKREEPTTVNYTRETVPPDVLWCNVHTDESDESSEEIALPGTLKPILLTTAEPSTPDLHVKSGTTFLSGADVATPPPPPLDTAIVLVNTSTPLIPPFSLQME
ncbi:hypothetical protein P4O66_000176 [Electrophorus voltai]|uniref:EGF-like domain-containing protein n=1 Tax=Electrophorus voltai TaxID=2609070 RepID=A0AAD8ZW80_9TELE|nr:hypothetical protein P4O66_000176 [Electrophorus voltai]